MLRRLPFGCTLLSLIALGGSAHAESAHSTFRLSAGGPLFATESRKFESGSEAKQTRVSLLGSGFGLGLGFVADNAVIGARVAFDNVKDDEGNSATAVSIAPRVEISFDDGAAAPYVVGTLGYRSIDSDGFEASDVMYGAGFGLNIFPESNVSLDPELLVVGLSGSTGSNDAKSTGWGVLLGFTLSAWLGGEPVPASAATPSPAVAAGSRPTPQEYEVASYDRPGHAKNVPRTDLSGGVVVDTTVGPLPFRLIGRPKSYGNISSSELKLPATATECRDSAFQLGEELLPASNVKLKQKGLAVALWNTSALLRVGEYDGEVRFVGCGFSATLKKSDRQAIASYMREFRAIAERYGKWTAVEVEEVEEEDSEKASDGADAAAATADESTPTEGDSSEPPPSAVTPEGSTPKD